MNSDLFLYVEHQRARELRAEAERHRVTTKPVPAVRRWQIRLGWTLVEMGLRLVHRRPAHN
ncbi:hypothetical protein FE391_23775 [Nonomuraea sp. KC401]|uniref:Uncharacterized protein n=2 Tax=Streptosporangiaceae TaxID=2004 RepID=A0A4R4MWH1_9ACTN|nr:hypothetical protein [Nonomuraea sp. K271]TDB99703.1 hypothetical protein E1267_36790 [Nonomuraea longispora]TLF67984.1 hypothetical protein FE391_23775 [Nonomuraea sp. KC401]